MPFDKEMALLLLISTTYPYFHLFSSGAKLILVKQATRQDHTLFSILKEKLIRSNYYMALLTFVPLSLSHI